MLPHTVLSVVSGSLALTENVFKKLNALRLALNHLQDTGERWDILSLNFTYVKSALQRVHEKIQSDKSLLPEEERDISLASIQFVRDNLERASKVVDKIDDLFPSSESESATCSNTNETNKKPERFEKAKQTMKKVRTVFNETFKIESLEEDVKTVESSVKDAMNELSGISRTLGMHNRFDTIEKARGQGNASEDHAPHSTFEGVDVFVRNFCTPKLPPGCVLDFSPDENGYYRTAEGRLKQSVLALLSNNERDSVVASGQYRDTESACGMGGVGKSVAVQGLCHDDEVRRAYEDGVCFLVLGQDASDRTVIERIATSVRLFRGLSLAAKIEKLEDLEKAVEHAAPWFSERTILFVWDDIWPTPNSSVGYLVSLRKLMNKAPNSKIVATTRDRKIASEMNSGVHFDTLVPRGEAARKILLKQLRSAPSECPSAVKGIEFVLDKCAGLPLALSIAGTALRREVDICNEDFVSGIDQYCKILESGVSSLIDKKLRDYPGLSAVIDASLKQCQQWGSSPRTTCQFGRSFNMIEMFESLCVLEKQMIMPTRVLKLLWDVNDKQANAIMGEFATCNLATNEKWKMNGERGNESGECGLRLHDLVLQRCQLVAENKHMNSNWHDQILKGYYHGILANEHENEEDEVNNPPRSLSNTLKSLGRLVHEYGRTDHDLRDCRPRWKLRDDGYIYGNIARHLLGASLQDELECLLCDVRWTFARIDVGGWISLQMDFEVLLGAGIGTKVGGIVNVRDVLQRSWQYVFENRNEIGFQVFGRIARGAREEKHVRKLLWTIERHARRPWLRPVSKCILPEDVREYDIVRFGKSVQNLVVDWEKKQIIFYCDDKILIWCMRARHTVSTRQIHESDASRIATIDYRGRIYPECLSVAMSPDGKFIYSCSIAGTIRRWNADRRQSIGDLMLGQNACVTCVTVSPDGKFIYSGSFDGTIRGWNADTGQSIGDPKRGHDSYVTCMAVSPDGKFIYSGSDDRTIRGWNADTGQSIGDPLRGHDSHVACVAVSPDGKFIYSGSSDGTIRGWNADRRQSIGDPMRGHDSYVTCMAVSPDGKFIYSGSDDGSIRVWKPGTGDGIGGAMLRHEPVLSVAVSPSGKFIYSRPGFGPLCRWKAKTGERMNGLGIFSTLRSGQISFEQSWRESENFSFNFSDDHRRVRFTGNLTAESPVATLPSRCSAHVIHCGKKFVAFGLRSGQIIVCSIVR